MPKASQRRVNHGDQFAKELMHVFMNFFSGHDSGYAIAQHLDLRIAVACVISGRAPLDRLYQRWLFEDVFPNGGYIALSHAGNIPHRIMSANLHTSQARWECAKHPLLEFMRGTIHPDLEFDPTLIPSARYTEAPWRAFPAATVPSSVHAFHAH